MPETSEPEENESDNELQDEITNVDNAAMLLEDLLAKNNPVIQELLDSIKEYFQMIDQPAMTEDAVGALEKVIRYQEDLDDGKEFDENG
ncbi:8448_t:CDS:2, partial [Cetraspora pellucida]